MAEPKLVVVVRTDLAMSTGKLAAQVAHAAVTAALHALGTDRLRDWLDAGQPKVVVRVPDAAALEAVVAAARDRSVPVTVVSDAGRTELAPGTVTCCAVGPVDGREADRVTGALPLL